MVEIDSGRIEGRAADGVDSFKGIPYAAPPVGRLRFRPPAPVEPWTGSRPASAYGAEAPQDSGRVDTLKGPSGLAQSEDCLTLNVFAPGDGTGERGGGLPVMVFIHGGGFSTGTSGHIAHDGTVLARRGELVVVTINYRLGALGLLAHPCLRDDASGQIGNWALLDQIAALRWVNRNIGQFGGDPGNVTIFGLSAGGGSVGALAICPGARALFRRAIIQSSSPLPADRATHLEAAETLLDKLGIEPSLAALQAADCDAIQAAQPNWVAKLQGTRTAPRPFVDGDLLPDWPDAILATGLTDGLDLMVSHTRDEISSLAMFLPPEAIPRTDADLERFLGRLGLDGGALIAGYRAARRARGEAHDPWALWVALQSDRLIRVPSMHFLAGHAARGNGAWACTITRESDWRPAVPGDRDLGACHVIDLPLIFGVHDATPELRRLVGGTPGADELATVMQDAWIAFAQTGSPATEALAAWRPYDPETRATMMLGDELTLVEDPWGPERELMERAVPPPAALRSVA
jgi:para-nitrobenzyl esterase